MQWNELFDHEHEPSEVQIREFIGAPLFDELDGHLKETYKAFGVKAIFTAVDTLVSNCVTRAFCVT